MEKEPHAKSPERKKSHAKTQSRKDRIKKSFSERRRQGNQGWIFSYRSKSQSVRHYLEARLFLPLPCYPFIKTNMLVANVKDSICRQRWTETTRAEKTFLNKKETKVAKFQTP